MAGPSQGYEKKPPALLTATLGPSTGHAQVPLKRVAEQPDHIDRDSVQLSASFIRWRVGPVFALCPPAPRGDAVVGTWAELPFLGRCADLSSRCSCSARRPRCTHLRQVYRLIRTGPPATGCARRGPSPVAGASIRSAAHGRPRPPTATSAQAAQPAQPLPGDAGWGAASRFGGRIHSCQLFFSRTFVTCESTSSFCTAPTASAMMDMSVVIC